jgi:hypothetical protein
VRGLRQPKVFFLVLFLVAVPTQAFWFLSDLDLAEKLGLEAVVVAVTAMVFAIRHDAQLEVVTDKIETVGGELRGVAKSVPTRGIGVFPNYLSEVPGLIGRAKESISILCDTPAHGAFSNTPAFTEYWRMLRHLMVDGKIQIESKFFNASGRQLLHEAQIKEDTEHWSEWMERNRANCEAFDQLAHDLKVTPPSEADGHPEQVWAETPERYVQSMMAVNKTVLAGFDDDQIEELEFADPLHQGPSVYCWLRDGDQEAVFVIVPVRGIGVRDLAGFHTREPDLIRALGSVFTYPDENAAL